MAEPGDPQRCLGGGRPGAYAVLGLALVLLIGAPADSAESSLRSDLTKRIDAYAALFSGDGSLDVVRLAPFYSDDDPLPFYGAFGNELDLEAIDLWGRLELDPDAERIEMARVGAIGVRRIGALVVTTAEFVYRTTYPKARLTSVPLRQTAIWQREGGDGEWRMIHEHLSASADALFRANGSPP